MKKSLFAPLVFRNGVSAKNRVVLAPMTNKQSHADGTLSEQELRWLTCRAEGGFGTVMTCATHVAKDGQGWPGELGTFDDTHLPGLTRLATALHSHQSLAIAQIFHGGARADRSVNGARAFSASASEQENTRAASEADLERVIGQFAAAAQRAEKAGFDGVEIHGAHGYLLTQFLSKTLNQRTDRWGGSLENRARLIREVTRAVRRCVAAKFAVGVRISPENYASLQGLDLDESLQLAQWLADDGIDFLHLSLWRALLHTQKRTDTSAITAFRATLPSDLPVLVAGALWTRQGAEEALARGADGVALGRVAIINPDWPLKAQHEGFQPTRPPVTAEHLAAAGLSPSFIAYMRAWEGFVA
jgi:2,4-dienoyl-CoA reductase-like NADH-dependent reductase (Old Yellow Enzyme family)